MTEVHVEGRKVKDDEKPPKVTLNLLTVDCTTVCQPAVEHDTQSRQCLAPWAAQYNTRLLINLTPRA